MIKAEHQNSFALFFHQYNRWLLKRSFHSISITGASAALPEKGSLILMNHSSWWDPLILFYLNQTIWKKNAVAMMGEEGLRRFPFFRKLGAFSVDPQSPRSVIESLNYASEQLQSGRHVFLFPQGKETPLEKRPLHFFSGAGYLKEQVPDAPVVSVSFYHGLFHHQMPEWYVHTGIPMEGNSSWNRKRWTKEMEKQATDELNFLRGEVISGGNFQKIFHGKSGIGANWEKVKRKAGFSK